MIVPLAKPAIAAVALFNFLYAWNDFFAPLLFVGNNPKLLDAGDRPVAVPTLLPRRSGTSRWRRRLLFMLPVIIMFFLAQRVFIEGVTLTGVKG